MSNLLNKIPVSPLTVLGNPSVPNNAIFGTNFSVLSTGGYMEVYSIEDLDFIVLTGSTGLIEYSANTIPIQFNKGTGSPFSYDVITLNSDNISSGRRKIGMLVYVIEEKQVYQYRIDNYDTLWNAATGATGPGGPTVVVSNFGTTVKNNTEPGQNFINAWLNSGVDGVDNNPRWVKYYGTNLAVTGGTYDASANTINLINITGGTIAITGFSTGNTTLYWYAENSTPPTIAPIATGYGSIALGEGAQAVSGDMFVFGSNAGQGAFNNPVSNFIGSNTGLDTTGATLSNFIGFAAGMSSTGSYSSNFIGRSAGDGATDSFESNFLGFQAGNGAVNSNNSNFFGNQAGYLSYDSSYSNFIGRSAGSEITTSTIYSNFIGRGAGVSATTVNNSNFIGLYAGRSANNTSQSNFIGNQAGYEGVTNTNSNFIGAFAGYKAVSSGNANFIGNNAGRSSNSTASSNFIGNGAGYLSTASTQSNFIGYDAGYQTTNTTSSNFIGVRAGYITDNGDISNFIGYESGYKASGSPQSNFIGYQSGYQSTGTTGGNFIGYGSGKLAINTDYSNFIGFNAGSGATNSQNSNFFGYYAGQGATGSSYSNLFGWNVGETFTGNNIGANNIIIGKNISLPNATTNAINIGGVLFGINTYTSTTGNPSIVARSTGRIGINVVTPTEALHVSGNTLINGQLTANTVNATTSILPTQDITVNIGTPTNRFREVNTYSGTTTIWSATTIVYSPTLDLGLDSLGNSRILTANSSILNNDVLLGGSY
jgi:hypothetical protein